MLTLEHLSKTFYPGTLNERKALTDISLKLEEGDFVTIIGSNGAGKSTLFNAISGNIDVDEGRVILDGKDITDLKEYKRARMIGRLFQDPLKGTAPNMTIEENLSLSYLRGKKRTLSFGIDKKDREFFRSVLSELNLGLEDRLTSKMGLLSGGQRQAITLLMATMVPPKLLLLDEHTAALDPATAEKILALTKKNRQRKPHHHHDDHPQYQIRAGAGQPHHYDEQWAHHPGSGRQRARRDDSGKAAGPL